MTGTRRNRYAARVIVFDADDRVLLFRFTPAGRPPLWATAGGELDTGETFAQAARRELLEETGIDADPGVCVARRESDFVTFAGEPVHAVEEYFVVRVDDLAIDGRGHTETERTVMLEHRWWHRAEIAEAEETIFPQDLDDILASLEPS